VKRSASWQEKLLTEGSGLGPWPFIDDIEKRLRKEIPLARFVKQIEDELEALQLHLRRRTMDWLYEIALRARIEQETVLFAEKLLPKRDQDTGKNQLLTLLERLQESTHIKNHATTARAAKRLTKSLHETIYISKVWKGYASWGTLRPDLKNLVVSVERHLRRKHLKLLKFKYQRVRIIATMLKAMKLKKVDFDEDSLSRMLRPSRLKK
jgi:hypothetical protein